MALTLPYPNMNFVPLDVLTAAEQNQLVANIEYIANQFPVSSSNIDWATLAYKPGDTIELVDESFMINAIQKVNSGNNFIRGSLQLAKSISPSVTSVNFTPAPGGYQDAYRANGVIFSTNQLAGYTFTCGKHVGNNFASIDIRCDVPSAISLANNNLATLRLVGTISFS